ncbi:hypothetical protein [Candidatus Vidania fulgoroideorum]
MSKKAKKGIKILNSTIIFVDNFNFILKKIVKLYLKILNSHFYFFIIKDRIFISPRYINLFTKRCWGTYFSLIKNIFYGINKKFEKIIVLIGIEFNVTKKNNNLIFSLGYSKDINLLLPKFIKVILKSNKHIKLYSFYKNLLGNFCSKILSLKKYNLYKDKGIKFLNEKKNIKDRRKK